MSTKSKSATSNTPTQSFDTGLYGTASTGKTGTSYDPSAFESYLVNTTSGALPDYISQYINPTYDSETFKARQNALNTQATKSFENNVMNTLASRGLTRGSNVNQMSNEFGKTLADAQNELMASEDANNLSKINALLGLYQTPYNLMTGLTGNTQSAYNNMLGIKQAQNNQTAQNNAALWNTAAQGAALAAMSLSDRRLKENIDKIAEVDGFNIYRFDYIDGEKNQVGVIAQEMVGKCPECVIGNYKDKYMGVDYSKLPANVQAKINELKG